MSEKQEGLDQRQVLLAAEAAVKAHIGDLIVNLARVSAERDALAAELARLQAVVAPNPNE